MHTYFLGNILLTERNHTIIFLCNDIRFFCYFRYGRRIIILIGLAAQAIFGVGVAFAPNLYIYVLLRFVVGMTISAVIMNAFVLGK